MKLNDLYFRGFTLYKKELEKDKEASKLRHVIKQTNIDNDRLETVRYICKIDEEWVKNIEEGMVYVEKALREERQFIRTEGEVVPIEKAKHTSKTTVEHLAKHSNFITHVPENPADDLVPDKLYIVEKESDYAVYENRFLYLLLTYLRDFLAIRLNKIRDKMTTYHGKYSTVKDVHLSHRNIQYEIKLADEIKDDPILIEKYKSIPVIDRIEMQYHLVLSFLSTPLMEQVSKAPMLKPPIIKTNTLKMNTNFKTSLALYDYISAYNTPGYEFEEEVVSLHPLKEEVADEYARVLSLNAFLTYKNANNLSKSLKKEFEKNEKELKEQERIQRDEQLKRLRRHLNESNLSYEEYLVLLENHNRDLEKDSAELKNANKTIEALNKQIKEIEQKNKELIAINEQLNENIIAKDEEITIINAKHATDLLVLEQVHREDLDKLSAKHRDHINKLNEEHQIDKANAIEETRKIVNAENKVIIDKANLEIESLKNEISTLNQKIENDSETHRIKTEELDLKITKTLDEKKHLIAEYEDKIFNLMNAHKDNVAELNNQILDKENAIEECNQKIAKMLEEKQFIEAQLHILRVEQGRTTDEYDYTSKERFEELEHQYRAFKKLFKKEWNKTKKRIRAELYAKVDEELKQEKANKKSKKKIESNNNDKVLDTKENQDIHEELIEVNNDKTNENVINEFDGDELVKDEVIENVDETIDDDATSLECLVNNDESVDLINTEEINENNEIMEELESPEDLEDIEKISEEEISEENKN